MKSVNEGMNQYCGPAVLSILTGKTTDECASVISAINGHKEVREVMVGDLLKAALKLRFTSDKIAADCSLFSLMHQIANNDGMYLVVVRKHVVAVEVKDVKILLCDNQTKEPISGAASARLGQNVVACYKVTEKEPAILISDKFTCHEFMYANGTISFSIHREFEFQDKEDNYKRYVGNITAMNREELKAVRNFLLEKV